MIQRTNTMASRVLLAGMLLAGAGGAQEADQICEWVVWDGPRGASEEELATEISQYRSWMADLRVRLLSGRQDELGDWQDRLEQIRRYSTSQRELPHQEVLMAEVAITRARGLAALGRIQEARAALDQLLYTVEDPSVQGQQDMSSSGPMVLAFAEKAAKDNRIGELRIELDAQLGAGNAEDDGLDQRLREAVRVGNWNLIHQVGTRAIPALEAAILESGEEFPDSSGSDPLSHLFQISQRRGATMALKHLESSGFSFRRRVLRAMDQSGVLTDSSSVWGEAPSEFEPRPCLVPEWPSIVAALLVDPVLAREAMQSLYHMLRANGVTPEVTTAVGVALTKSPDLVSDVMKTLANAKGNDGRLTSAKGIYEHLLTNPQPSVRRFAASELLAFPTNHALWAQAGDPDPLVREAVADSLRQRYRGKTITPVIDEDAVAAMRVLLDDPDPAVRLSATWSLAQLKSPVESAVYRRQVADPSPEVRAAMAFVRHTDEALMAEILVTLARDPSPDVRESIDNRLDRDSEWVREHVMLPAAKVRLLDPSHPADSREDLVRRMAKSEPGLIALIDCALGDSDESLRRTIWSMRNYFRSSTGTHSDAYLALDDARLSGLFKLLSSEDAREFTSLMTAISNAESPRWEALLPIVEDEAALLEARLAAASYAAAGGGERLRGAVIGLLSKPPLRDRKLSRKERNDVLNLVENLPRADVNPLALAALKTDQLRDSTCALLVNAYTSNGAHAAEITKLVLARWLQGEQVDYASPAVYTALFHLRTLPEERSPELMGRALLHPEYAEPALNTMGSVQDVAYLPSIRTALSADWIILENTRRRVQSAAIRALASFPDQEATDILLDAMVSSPSSEVRMLSSSALEARRKAMLQRAEWDRANEMRLQDVDTATRLLELLKDADPTIRAQAARGLGTLGALEALPILIEALRDENAAVRSAISDALDRLNQIEADTKK